MRIRHTPKEEKVAVKIVHLLNDWSLDLEAVAFYLYGSSSYLGFRRVLEVLESAQEQEKNKTNERLEINREWRK